MNKKTFLCLAALIIVGNAVGQQIEKNRSALIYYMPKTEVMLDVEYERTDSKVGMFYRYSQRYLGVSDVIKADKTTYRIKSIRFLTRTVADKSRAFSIRNNAYNIGVSLTDDGILCGINTVNTAKICNEFEYINEVEVVQSAPTIVAPLGEEQLLSGSEAKMAESTAKQIYHIRESRINLLAGEAESMPTDGEAVRLILEQLDLQEKALCALFVGTEETTLHHAYFPIDLTESQDNQIIFRFSQLAGPVEANDLSGSPVVMTLKYEKMTYAASPKENKTPRDAVYYNIPGDASITIRQNNQILAQKDLKVAQLGIAVPMELSMMLKKVIINPETGLISQVQ